MQYVDKDEVDVDKDAIPRACKIKNPSNLRRLCVECGFKMNVDKGLFDKAINNIDKKQNIYFLV